MNNALKEDQSIRVIFMGTPEYAQSILDRLLEESGIEVVMVVTQPDRPVGRKRVLSSPPVKESALRHGVEVLQPSSLRDESIQRRMRDKSPDFIVVAAFGQILPREILEIAPSINLHASLLPAYRGASPIQQALLRGDRITGITAMLMEEGLDRGPALAYSYIEIDDSIRLGELTKRLTMAAAELTPKVLRRFEELEPLVQFDAQASYCAKILRSDGEIDFEDASLIRRKYRAFEGWPGLFLPGGLKLIELEFPADSASYNPGEILDISDQSIDVGCRRGRLRICTLQPAGKRQMSAKAYCVGRGLKRGDYLL